jgi:hypothetical protein
MAEVQEIRVIKRYANRKLYDTRDSKYVTLDRIAEFVRNGEEVKVIDTSPRSRLPRSSTKSKGAETPRLGRCKAFEVSFSRGARSSFRP